MAEQLLLVRTYDFEADQDSVNLLTRTVDGFEPAYGGWTPNVTASKKGFVSEAITVRVQGTSTDHIASNLQKLADKAEEVQRYIANGARDYAVWFRVQMYGETKGRQTLVQELRHEPASSVYDVGLRSAYHWNQYIVGIDHAPWWEGTACGTVSSGSINCIGGTLAYGTIAGNLPARIAQIKLSNISGTGLIFPGGKAWVGFKSNRYGSVSLFNPYYSLGTATAIISGIYTRQADTETKGGSRLVFAQSADGTQYFVAGGILGYMTSAPQYWYGDYMVLLRARVPGTATFLAQLRTGYQNDFYFLRGDPIGEYGSQFWPNAKSYPRVAVDSDGSSAGTVWRYYEMGKVSIPFIQRTISQTSAGDNSFLVFAEKISGGTTLYIDGLVFVPMDGYMSVSSGTVRKDITRDSNHKLLAVQSPDGIGDSVSIGSAAYTSGTSVITAWATSAPTFEGGMQAGYNGLVVLAAEGNDIGTIKTQALNVEIKYFERWEEIRGND